MMVPPGGIGLCWYCAEKAVRTHLTLEFQQHVGGLVLGMKEFALLSLMDATVTEKISFGSLRDGGKVQHFKPALFLQVARQIVLMDALHDQYDAGRRLVVGT